MVNEKSVLKKIPVFNKYEKPSVANILEENEFHIILNVERARADRSDSVFSLVVFEVEDLHKVSDLNKFIKSLQSRIRAVDIIGWFEKKTVGIILHSTNMEGAWKFAMDVGIKFFPKHMPIPFVVFSYPEHWYNEKDLNFKNFYKSIEENNRNNRNIYSISNRPVPETSPLDGTREKVKKVLTKKSSFWKRAFDIVMSFTGLIFMSPMFILVAVYIKLVSKGPVFFKQDRVGYKGKTFTLYKFRTMHLDNNENFHQEHFKDFFSSDKPMVKLDNKKDPRIIPGGSLLRKACVDELPQLINVLIGDMSLVGPRPCIPYEAEEYERWHHRRFDVVPGMTGLWQVSGKNSLTFKEMVRLDITYSEKISLGFDLYIIFKTIPTIAGLIFDKVKKQIKI